MSNNNLSKKDTSIRETFYNLCKSLMRYLDRRIVKKYIQPNQAQIPKNKKIQKKNRDPNVWVYFYDDEDLTQEDIIKDVFKDNIFIGYLQSLEQNLEIIVNYLDNNKLKNEEIKYKSEIIEKQEKMKQKFNANIIHFAYDENNSNKFKNENPNNYNLKQEIIPDKNIINTINLMNMLEKQIPNEIKNYLNMNFPNLIQNIQNFKNGVKKNDNCFTCKKPKETKVFDFDDYYLSDANNSSKNNTSSENEENKEKENLFLNKKTNRQQINLKQEESSSEKDDSLNSSFGSKKEKIDLEEFLNNIKNPNNNSIDNIILKKRSELESLLQKKYSLINEEIKEIQGNKINLNDKIKTGFFVNKLSKLCNDEINKNKNIQGPYIIGSFSHINYCHLKTPYSAIDLLFKCNQIKLNNKKTENLIKETIMNVFEKILGIKYQLISKRFENNFLKIKIKYGAEIFFDLYFIENENLDKETEKLILDNRKYKTENENEKKLLTLYLFFRNWRKKGKLFFIIPEKMDEIINLVYDGNEILSENIYTILQFLYNGKINNKNLDESKREIIKKKLDCILKTDAQKKMIVNSINNNEFLLWDLIGIYRGCKLININNDGDEW